jgi:hypothetical protein
MLNKFRLGILGCANIAKKSMISNFVKSNRFEISAIASRNLNSAVEFCNNFGGKPVEGYDNLINMSELDCIYIPLPTGMHYEWARKALLNGKHVFLEKSFCENLDQTKELINLSINRELVIIENFMYQENDQYTIMNNILNSGSIGTIKLIKSTFGFPLFDKNSNIRYDNSLGGGALLDAGAYVLNSLSFITKEKQNISSSIMKYSNDFGVDFHGYVSTISESGIVSQVSYGFDNFYQNNIIIWGNKGILKMNRAFTSPEDFSHSLELITGNNNIENISVNSYNPGIKLCKKFADLIDLNDFSSTHGDILNQAQLINDVKKIAVIWK